MSHHPAVLSADLVTWPACMWAHAFRTPDGGAVSADQARAIIAHELALGHRLLPVDACDRWDWQQGCQGHEEGDG